MQLKATKLAALFSRLHFALSPALALLMLVGLAAPLAASADQWVRFTITKKMKDGLTESQLSNFSNRNYVQLDEFGLYSADGIRQNSGLTMDTSHAADAIAPGSFHFARSPLPNNPTNLFIAGTEKWCYSESGALTALEAGGTNYIVFTMHLREDAAPVVKYNLRSGGDTAQFPGRAPVCWRVETSDNGIDWIVRDVRDDQATSGYTTENNTWYGGGGSSNDGPTTFYPFSSIDFLKRLAADERRVAVDDDPYATGGDMVLKDGDNYIHVFYDPSAAKTFTVNKSCSAEILAVGGGGSGGGDCGGGGGAGGLVYKENVLLTPNDYTVTVGAGGAGPTEKIRGNTGSGTSFKLGDANVIDVALGGGGGGKYSDGNGASGGSGGGACNSGGAVGVGSNGQGNNGGKGAGSDYGGGGGGAGAAGSDSDGANGGSGGDGLEYGLRFFGWQQYFAGGGGGGNAQDSNDSVGGLGGGGKGGCKTASTFSAGENGLGAGGGGGGGGSNKGGGAGGSGIVIIRCSPRAAQWFRLTIAERWGYSYDNGDCYDGLLQIGEFALFDENGNQVNAGLTLGLSADGLSAGEYHFAGGNADKLFDGAFLLEGNKWCYNLGGGTPQSRTANLPQSITMRLAEDAATVAKYNLATGNDQLYRHPAAWKLEASSDGVNWTVVDEQRIDSEPTLSSWYAGGGKGEKPTKFYALQPQELPLPAGFTRLEWIKSTRQQRILTDYYPNSKTWMQVDCSFSGEFHYNGNGFSNDDGVFFFGTDRNGGHLYQMNFGGGSTQTHQVYAVIDDTKNAPYFFAPEGSVGGDGSRGTLTVCNGAVTWKTVGGSGMGRKTLPCEDPLVLFGCGDLNFGSYDMTVWSWKIYESDSGSGVNDPSSHLVHNFIPALSPTGVPGLFDSITGEFLSSATATPFEYQEAGQWFRFTILKRLSNEENFIIQLGKFGLYTADGKNVATNLARYTTDAQSVPAGQFYYSNNVGNLDAFHSEWLFDEDYSKDHKFGATSAVYARHTFTMHLAANADEVVKYNMMSANDTAGAWLGRAPSMWTLERSYDGVVWEMVDEQLDEATCGYPTTGYTWYNNGGQYNTTTGANSVPSNFYWFAELPLPELLQSEYDYVGYKLVPAVKGAEGLIASGTTAATNTGTYKIVYSLPAGAKWVGGSTAPYEIEWSIVSPRPKFLERLAADTRRVDDTPSVYSAYATGGDLVLKDTDLGVFIHVFTNTAAASDFTVNQALNNVEVLLVGGGGAGGSTGGDSSSGGGGAGGYQHVQGIQLQPGGYSVAVGKGGVGRRIGNTDCGLPGSDSIVSVVSVAGMTAGAELYKALHGGLGGSFPNRWGGKTAYEAGQEGGCGGGQASTRGKLEDPEPPSAAKGFQGGAGGYADATSKVGAGGGGAGEDGHDNNEDKASFGGNGLCNTILGFRQCFAGGGAGGREAYGDTAYVSNPVEVCGSAGGGGFECHFNDHDTKGWYYNGENGLGGGGAGDSPGLMGDQLPHRGGNGGDGIVIVRYSYNTTANVKVAKPTAKAGLLYNGCTQLAVEEGEGYVLSGRVSADNAGSYTATATLLAGYEWADGSTSALTLNWRIDPAPITGVRLSANEAQYTGDPVTQPTIVAVTTANGLTITDANCGWDFGYERDRKETTDFIRLGYISVVVTGKGNLTGTKAATFRIYDPTKIPLPKPSQVYEYTGSTITPTFEPAPSPATYTLSGVTSTNAIGVYTVTCTLAFGCSWENGSTGPYEVTWEIVKKQTFLEKLASDPRRVNDEGETDFDSGLAQGGDLVLFDPEASAFIHVFTNTAEAATFTAKQDLNAWVLAVGGGGGGGSTNGGGGGAGGMIEDKNLPFAQEQSVPITIGAGAPGVASGHGSTGSQTQINIPGLDSIIAYGGGGGGCVDWHLVTDQNPAKVYLIDGYGGENVGSGGGAGGYFYNPGNPSGSGVPGRSITMYKGVKQGNDGGAANSNRSCPAGGGGGAGGVGETSECHDNYGGRHGGGRANVGGYGGEGRLSDILGFSQYFAGGGASGGNDWGSGVAFGGVGGGGNGAGYVKKGETDDSVPKAQTGENGLGGGGGGGKGGDVNPLYNPGAAGGDGIVIIRYMATPPITVPVPTAKTGLFYNGNTQVGVPESFAYTLADYYATTAGTYTATATLNYGYRWADSTGDNDLTRTVEWEIASVQTKLTGSVKMLGWYVGEEPPAGQPSGVVVAPVEAAESVTYKFYSDKACTLPVEKPTAASPVGTYYVRAEISDGGNYAASVSRVTEFNIVERPDMSKYRLVEWIATTNCQYLDTGVDPWYHGVTNFGFRLDFVDSCYSKSSNNGACIMGSSFVGKDFGSGFWWGLMLQNWNNTENGCFNFCRESTWQWGHPFDMLGIDSEHRFVLEFNRLHYSATSPEDPSYKYEFDMTSVTAENNNFAGSVYLGAAQKSNDRPATSTEPSGFADNRMTFYALRFYDGVDVIYDAVPAIEIATGRRGLVRTTGTEGVEFAYSARWALGVTNVWTAVSVAGSDFGVTTIDELAAMPLGINEFKAPLLDLATILAEEDFVVRVPDSMAVKGAVDAAMRTSLDGHDETRDANFVVFYAQNDSATLDENAVINSELPEDLMTLAGWSVNPPTLSGASTKVRAAILTAVTKPCIRELTLKSKPMYHVIRPDGPEIEVDEDWLMGAFGEQDEETYQAKLFTTNANGVVAWQAYVMGAAETPEAVANMAIVEETVQNANPATVTIQLKDMPTPRSGTGCTVKYSLLSASTPEGLAEGGGTVVTNKVDLENVKEYFKWPESTFEAPLSDLSDEKPVNYYRIKVHFIFGGGK